MIIYKITNKINGKVYIGQTVQTLKLRVKSHFNGSSKCLALVRAIRKYGRENFTVTQIDKGKNRKDLNEKEMFWIKKYESMGAKGYNLTQGGDNITHSPEAIKKMSEAAKGRVYSEEYKRKMSPMILKF